MGSNRRKRTKQCSESDTSDVNESTQPPTTSTKDTSSQHFPRFILVENKEENKPVTSLSPFVIQKVIQSIAVEPENIKKLHRSNQLLIEVSRKAHAENLLRAQTFHDGNLLPRIGELQRGGDSRRHKISRSNCNKTIQS